MGPIISKRQLETIEKYVQVGTSEGAHVAAGGARPADPSLGGGYYFQPTLLESVSAGMRVAQEEIFGPVLTVIPYDNEDQAVALANDSIYGLAGGVWASTPDRAMTVARRLRTDCPPRHRRDWPSRAARRGRRRRPG